MVKKAVIIAATVIGTGLALVAVYTGYLYASTPLSIREPLFEHYHFRMSLTVNGKEEDFGAAKYQEGYAKDNCNAQLTNHPIHFHDKRNHFVHIHWEGMTGGQVLKYYGWNLIGGTKGSLGYRFDEAPSLQKVPLHGNILPAMPDNANYYIYTGNANKYAKRQLTDFISQDLEKFFNKTSNSPAHQMNQEKRNSLLDSVFPKAHAQADHTSMEAATGDAGTEMDHDELTQLNNLVGDVVIFAQKDQPSDTQIKARFDGLEPLGTSTCGG